MGARKLPMETSGATSDGTLNPHHEIPLPPISRLPTELLISILHLALPISDLRRWPLEHGFHSYMPMLYTLRRMSKRWQGVVDGTPSFWALILSTLPPHVNETALLRSGSHPLTVVHEYPKMGSKDTPLSPEDFLRTAVEARPRWLSYSGPVVPEYFQAPAPLMQHIALRGRSMRHPRLEPLELLGGCTSSLWYIDLEGVSVRWRAGLFTQLKVLDLKNVRDDGLTAGHILDFLGASPQLERLALYGVRATDDGAQSSSVITLHHLRYINISNCDITGDILRQIRAPASIYLDLEVDLDRDDDLLRFLDEALHHFQGNFQTIHARNGSSLISFSLTDFIWFTREDVVDGHDMWVEVMCHTPLPCIRWVEQILQGRTGLGIAFGMDADLTYDAMESMAPMRCVTRVVVDTDLQNRIEVVSILQFISAPLSAGASLPLPCLREVQLDGAAWNDQDLLDMVQSRSHSLSLETEERPLLTISMERGAFISRNNPRPIVGYATLTKIRETNGVERVQFVGSKQRDGMLAIIWNEEAGEPIWG